MSRIAFVDDNKCELVLMKAHTKGFNSHNVFDKVEGFYYSDHKEFLVEHARNPFDCVVMDFHLDGGVTGAEVMQTASTYNESTIFIMVSADFKDSLKSVSFIPKKQLKVSEIMNRFMKLKNNWLYNLTEINIRLAENPQIFSCPQTTIKT